VIARRSWIEKAKDGLPTMLSYKTHLKGNSLYNTPPVFPIYVVGLVLAWLKNNGGIDAMEKTNQKKAALLYDALDSSDGFYRGTVKPDSRSIMNVTFRLPSEELEEKFVSEAKKQGLVGLKGHRSVGGCRASLYNALPVASVEALVAFMGTFRKAN